MTQDTGGPAFPHKAMRRCAQNPCQPEYTLCGWAEDAPETEADCRTLLEQAVEALKRWTVAVDDLCEFERDNPNDLSKAWKSKMNERDFSEDHAHAFLAAYDKAVK
jgi:hypothetical protein